MKKEIAESLMEKINQINKDLDNFTDIVYCSEIEGEEKKAYRKGIARVAISIYENMMRPIVKEYPDLDPDKEFLDTLKFDKCKST